MSTIVVTPTDTSGLELKDGAIVPFAVYAVPFGLLGYFATKKSVLGGIAIGTIGAVLLAPMFKVPAPVTT